MFKIDDNNIVSKTSNITEVNFIMLASQNDKETFEVARKEANLNSEDDLSFSRTVQGIYDKTANNEPYFGIYGIYSQDKQHWTWYPINTYIQLLSKDIALAEKAAENITTLFLLNNR